LCVSKQQSEVSWRKLLKLRNIHPNSENQSLEISEKKNVEKHLKLDARSKTKDYLCEETKQREFFAWPIDGKAGSFFPYTNIHYLIWAISTDRKAIARRLVQRCDHPMLAALLASSLYGKLQESRPAYANEYEAEVDHFDDLATSVLDALNQSGSSSAAIEVLGNNLHRRAEKRTMVYGRSPSQVFNASDSFDDAQIPPTPKERFAVGVDLEEAAVLTFFQCTHDGLGSDHDGRFNRVITTVNANAFFGACSESSVVVLFVLLVLYSDC
jgi:hypothetical protein